MSRLRLSRPARLRAASLAGALHFALQVGTYVLAFAVGPEGATREVLGVSLYGIASVLTFPFVPLAERLGWRGVGMLALPLNSLAWAGGFYATLSVAARLVGRGARER